AAEPAADGRGEQGHGAGETGCAGIDFPHGDDGTDHQRIDLEIHAVERPAGRASPERPPLRQVHIAIKCEKASVLNGGEFDGFRWPDAAHYEFSSGGFGAVCSPCRLVQASPILGREEPALLQMLTINPPFATGLLRRRCRAPGTPIWGSQHSMRGK